MFRLLIRGDGMDFKNVNWMVVGAAGASVGVFWNQIKSIFDQITSLVFISFSIESSERSKPLMRYMWDHYKLSSFGKRSYGGYNDFIRPRQSYGVIATKTASSSMIFWNGWKPLFVSYSYNANSGVKYEFTFIRGMFDSDALVVEAAKYYNDIQGPGGTQKRFLVRKFHGQAASIGSDKESVPETESDTGAKVLGYDDSEIGIPTNELPFDSLCYTKNVKDFKEYLKRWKESREWYLKRGIPWKTGALLYGKPGTGKTSFVRAIAQELDMPIAVMDLTSMSNEELNKSWKDAMNMAPVIVLFEDLDRIFNKDKNTSTAEMNLKSPLTFDALLNCMSGIDPSDGVLVMITANDVTRIDSAIGEFNEHGVSSRPGRLDIALEFSELDEECRRGIACRILHGMDTDFINKIIIEGDGETGAQFTKRCSDIALKSYWDHLNNGEKHVI